VSVRVARSRRLVAEGYALATVARVMQISRQALYRVPTPRAAPQRRLVTDPVEAAIVEEALANRPTATAWSARSSAAGSGSRSTASASCG